MSSITAQQTKLDLELVPKENRIDIGKCNGRIPRGLTPREPTFQVVLDAIALTPCYPAFLITADVPEVYMHQFWNSMYKHDTFYRFKIDKKKRFKLTLEVFRDIFQICPRVQGREFDPLPSEEDTVSFLRELGHTGEINSLNDVVVDQMHQPWRTFAALINRSLSGKTSGLDKLRLSRAQILWGMFHQKNVDYVELLWEDFIYQIENRVYKKQEKMYYPRFTKVIIHHFLIQEKSLSWRNKIGMHTSKDDYLINTLRFVSAKEATQIYGVVLPKCLTSLEMKDSKAYKTYLGYATGVVPPKISRKFKKASTSKKDSVVIREAPVETKSKSKENVDVTRGKGIELLSETYPSGSGTVTEKPQSVDKITPTVTSEGTGDKPGVPDMTEDDSTKSESESWGNDEDDSNNEQESSNEGSEQENESGEQESNSEQEEESEDDGQEEEEFVHTPTDDKDDDNLESESDDVIKSDEEKGMDDTTYQFDDDVDARLKEPTQTDKEVVQGEGADAEMNDAQQGNENLETTQEQVVEDAHVTISTVTKKTEVPVTSSSRSSDLASKFLNFLDIPHADAEIVSPLDVHVHHEVPRTQAPTLLTIPVSVITESSPVYTNIPQSSQTFTPPPILTTPNPPPTIETTNPLSTLPDFASVFRFNDRITALEKEVAELKKDPLHTQVTTLVDEHLDTRLGETREEFMKFLSESLTTRIKEQVKDQLPQILPKEVSNFAPPVIKKLIKESRDEKILLEKMEKSKSYLTAPEHRDCYDGLKKSYALDKDFFFSYDVYSLKQNRKDKDKDEDPSAGSDRGLKKRKLSKDAEPTTRPKKKDSTSGSSKGTKNETASRRDWFKKPTPPQEPTDPDWNIGKTTQEGPTQNWLMTLAASTSTDKSLKDFDELMSTPIDFSGYILNGLKIENLTQEILLGPAFRLLKGTRSNYAELEYDFEECYKALSEKLDWENPEGGDYPFDLSKPLPLITRGNRQRVPFEFFINNDLKYLQGGVLTMTYTTSTTKSKAAKYDLPGIKEMVPNIWSPVKVAYDRCVLWRILHWRQQFTHVSVMRKHGYGYLGDIIVRRADNTLYRFKEGDFPRLRINDIKDISLVIQRRVKDLQLGVESYQKHINVTKPDTTRPDLRKRHPYTPYKDPQGFIYVDDYKRNRLMRSNELYKFSDGTLTRLLSSLEDITKNIDMTFLPKRRWSNLEKKRAHFMIKDINKLLKERRMMRSLEKFVRGRLYETDLKLLQRTI
ncbi:hypothetical protein Tco_1108449 [Tanacetum coccineum]